MRKREKHSTNWRRAALAVIPAALLLATVLLMREAQPVRAASPDAAKARSRAECGKVGIQKTTTPVIKKTPPAPTMRKVESLLDMALLEEEMLVAGGDIQWCWGQHCVHTQWWCPDPYDARDLGPCTVACCLGGNCGPSVTCESRAE